MVLLDLEKQDPDKASQKLDKIYLSLVKLYLQENNFIKVKQILSSMELRLEALSNKDAYSYKMMNELANVLVEKGLKDDGLQFYKKSLICLKRRHKNNFMALPETAKILFNMAKVYQIIGNYDEVQKLFYQAVEVW